MEKLFGRAFAVSGYDYNEEVEHSSVSDIYCDSKQARMRGGDFLVDVGEQITRGLNAQGEGEITLNEQGMTVEHLAREDFAEFRKFLGVDEARFLDCFSSVTGGATNTTAGGRSGSLYWFSKDGRFLLKSANAAELDKLLDMMPRYVAHFKEAEKAGRPCYLTRIFGAYRFKVGEDTLGLFCMNDVWDGKKPERLYDLKGTTHHRLVEDESPGVVLKDSNLMSYFLFPQAGGDKILEALEEDAIFLENENSMDYSLLLGVDDPDVIRPPNVDWAKARNWERLPVYDTWEVEEPESESGGCHSGKTRSPSNADEEESSSQKVVRMGIIDFLGQWTAKKKAEGVWKTLTVGCCHEHSSVSPDKYRDRWVGFMEEHIVVDESDKTA